MIPARFSPSPFFAPGLLYGLRHLLLLPPVADQPHVLLEPLHASLGLAREGAGEYNDNDTNMS